MQFGIPVAFAGALLCALSGTAADAREYVLGAGQVAVGSVIHMTARPGDTVAALARRFDLGFTEVMAANPELDPEGPIAGADVVLPAFHILPDAPRTGIVVNLAAQRLFYFAGDRVITFPVGVALAGHETPLGVTQIVDKQRDPVWRPTPTIRADQPWLAEIVPPGPRNPLGAAALYLGWPAYLIHGTNMPEGIGRSGSYGCLSLYPEDIASLFRIVPVGTQVRTVRQDVAVAWAKGALIAQIYPNEEQGRALIPASTVSRTITAQLRSKVASEARRRKVAPDLKALETARWERSGLPVRLTP